MAINPLNVAGGALYLATYTMEAVGFTEFIFEEATQQGLRVLRQMKKKKGQKHLNYMGRKFRENVITPGWVFHVNFGGLNPYTNEGFEAFWNKAWKEFDAIIYLNE